MIKPFTEELFQQLLAAVAEENAAERRHLLSQHLVIDETMDANIQRDIVLDALYVATDFAIQRKYDYASTAALVEVLAAEFISLMDPAYDFNRPPAELIQEMKRIFLEKVQQSHHPVELQTWAEIAEYLALHILPQRQTFHYMFHNMPIVIDKTVTLCVDTPMRTHLPLSAATSSA